MRLAAQEAELLAPVDTASLNKALLAAAESGDIEAARAALDGGAEATCADNVRCAHAVGALSATYALPASARRQYSKTALLFAAEKGHAAIAKLALERGCDANGKDFVRPTSFCALAPLLRLR
jgi:ankyrin repeat protein